MTNESISELLGAKYKMPKRCHLEGTFTNSTTAAAGSFPVGSPIHATQYIARDIKYSKINNCAFPVKKLQGLNRLLAKQPKYKTKPHPAIIF